MNWFFSWAYEIGSKTFVAWCGFFALVLGRFLGFFFFLIAVLADGLEDSVCVFSEPSDKSTEIWIGFFFLFLYCPSTFLFLPEKLIRFLIAVFAVKWLLTLFSERGRERCEL